jgi:hypothetical protein
MVHFGSGVLKRLLAGGVHALANVGHGLFLIPAATKKKNTDNAVRRSSGRKKIRTRDVLAAEHKTRPILYAAEETLIKSLSHHGVSHINADLANRVKIGVHATSGHLGQDVWEKMACGLQIF